MVTPCELETEVFGKPVGKTSDPLCEKADWWLLHYRAQPGASPPGFRHVGTLVTLKIWGRGESTSCRPAVPEDIGSCREIAKSFRYDRFHADPRIPLEQANELKARWIENAIRGRAEKVWVAEGGFLSVLPGGRIDLICVEPKMRGRGVAKRLLHEAFRTYPVLTVGTQAANEESLKLYADFNAEEMGRLEDWHWCAEEGEDRQPGLHGS